MNTWSIARKELRHYFSSPIAYVIMVAYFVINAWLFTSDFLTSQQATLRAFFSNAPLIMLFFVPAFSMRSMAEEKKQGTIELLLTFPIKDEELIAGKYLGLNIFLALVLATTLPFAISVESVGSLDWGPVIGGYLGLMFSGAVLLSIGIFASSITDNQIIAFIISLATGFGLFIIGQFAPSLPDFMEGFANYIGLTSHFDNISKGIIDTRDLLYYFSIISFMLFLTWQTLVNRK